MYKLIRTCKVLPKVITAVQRATTVVEPRYDLSIWHRLRLDGSPTRLCTSLTEVNNIPCSDKILANTTEEQLGYGSKRIYNYYINTDDSSTDNSDSDCCERLEAELKAIAMGEEEAQTQKEILAKFKEGELYAYNPSIEYEPLKRFDVPRFVVSVDSSTNWFDSGSDTENETIAEEEAQTQKDKLLAGTQEELLSHYNFQGTSLTEVNNIPCSDKILANTTEEQLGYGSKRIYNYYINTDDSSTDNSDSDCCKRLEAELKAIAMGEEEAQTQKEFLAEFKEGELYAYNPSIKYEPLQRFDVPRFVVSEDSSTNWFESRSDTENETIAEEEAQTQKDKLLAGTSLTEDNSIPCSDKSLANTTEEQLCYVSKKIYKYIHTDNSSTYNSDSDGYERLEAERKARAMGEEEAQSQKEILAKYKEGELNC